MLGTLSSQSTRMAAHVADDKRVNQESKQNNQDGLLANENSQSSLSIDDDSGDSAQYFLFGLNGVQTYVSN